LNYLRKVVTIEPMLDVDHQMFATWIRSIRPEYVWLGINSKPESVALPEPAPEKVQKLVELRSKVGRRNLVQADAWLDDLILAVTDAAIRE
jgi:hypothetical protein